jgi:hypothetical protein
MTLSRRVPAFDAAHFESLSHEEKLKLLSEFLDALAPSQPPSNGDSQEPARRPRRAQKST